MDSGLKTPVPDEAPAPEPGTLPGPEGAPPAWSGISRVISYCALRLIRFSITPDLWPPPAPSPACLAAALSGAGCWPCFTDGKVDAGELDPPEEE